jgi:hypothetical protein
MHYGGAIFDSSHLDGAALRGYSCRNIGLRHGCVDEHQRRAGHGRHLNSIYSLHCTKKLLDRVKPAVAVSSPSPTTVLGNRHAMALFCKPQWYCW